MSALLAATKTRGDALRFLWVLDTDARLMWAMAVDGKEAVYKSGQRESKGGDLDLRVFIQAMARGSHSRG